LCVNLGYALLQQQKANAGVSQIRMKNLHHHSKQQFQVERIVLFSDAVFAIAITLLIIDIKVPEIKSGLAITDHNFLESALSLIPKFVGFIISFFLISLYWTIHHKMFGFVVNYNSRLIWLNLLFLFSIVLMPFSTNVYSEYSSPELFHLNWPYAIYVFNITLTGFFNFVLWRYIGNPQNKVAEDLPGGDFLQKAKIRSLLLPAIFIVCLLVAIFIHPGIGRSMLSLTPVVMSLVRNKKPKNVIPNQP
ncbi:MAG: TMEM175 family protein, partial [Bacteroidota bacterium]